MMKCPVCDSESIQFVGSHLTYSIVRCETCDLIFSDPMKGAGSEFYGGTLDFESFGINRQLFDEVYVLRKLRYRKPWELETFHRQFLRRRPCEGGRLLEVGCGEGLFLSIARKWYQVTGIDIDSEAIRWARKKYGLENLHVGAVEDFLQDWRGNFDVVVMFEVLEHLENPVQTICSVRELLKDNGILVISIPNQKAHGSEHDPFEKPPNHLTRWSKKSLLHLLNKTSFEPLLLQDLRTQWPYGWLETEEMLPYRLRFFTTWLAKRTWSSRRMEYHGRQVVVHEHSFVIGVVVRTLRAISRYLWFPLWPYYFMTNKPTGRIYLEAKAL